MPADAPSLVILCAGPAGSGKSTAAARLVTRWGFHPVALADRLRAWAAACHLPPSRGVLQALGDAARAAYGPGGLIALADWPAGVPCVVPDIRLPAEIAAARARWPTCVVWVFAADPAARAARLTARDGRPLSPAEAAHPTETADLTPYADRVFTAPCVSALLRAVDAACDALGLHPAADPPAAASPR